MFYSCLVKLVILEDSIFGFCLYIYYELKSSLYMLDGPIVPCKS